MDNGRYSLIDMLDHQPDLLSDSKIKAMMSDIYDNMIGYMENGNEEQVSDLINSGGVRNFIQWFVENVYSPNTSDVKVISYVNENMGDILDVLSQALSNLTPKEVIDNMKEEKVDGADEVTAENGSDGAVIDNMKEELVDSQEEQSASQIVSKEEVPEVQSEHDKAFAFIDSMTIKR